MKIPNTYWKQQARPAHSYLPFPLETGVVVVPVLAQEEALGSKENSEWYVVCNKLYTLYMCKWSNEQHIELIYNYAWLQVFRHVKLKSRQHI